MSAEMEQIEAKLAAYVDGELDDAGRREIERFLAEHPQYRAILEELAKLRTTLRGIPRQAAPADLAETLSAGVERSALLDDADPAGLSIGTHSRSIRVLAAAAVLLLAVGLAAIVYFLVLPPQGTPTSIAIAPAPQKPDTFTPPPAELFREESRQRTAGDTEALNRSQLPLNYQLQFRAADLADRKQATNDFPQHNQQVSGAAAAAAENTVPPVPAAADAPFALGLGGAATLPTSQAIVGGDLLTIARTDPDDSQMVRVQVRRLDRLKEATMPATLPTTEPATLPASMPATVPATIPATLPTTEPATVPATLPGE